MIRIVCLVMGYILGLFQTAFIYGKCKGIDIRNYGSGNAGTTNTLRVLGPKAGVIVLLGDIAKCMIAVFLTKALFGKAQPEMQYVYMLYAATGVILGHDFPFYLKFKGGKGIAATAGLILSLHPAFIPMGVLVFFGIFLTTHYVSLGSLLVYLGFIIELVALGQAGIFGATQAGLFEMYALGAFLFIMAYWMHRENIKRLLAGQERKTYVFKKNGDVKKY